MKQPFIDTLVLTAVAVVVGAATAQDPGVAVQHPELVFDDGFAAAPGCETCVADACGTCEPLGYFAAGFQFTFVKPRFDSNVAFTTMASDGDSFETFVDTEFDYDVELTPRVWFGWECQNGLGLRTQYWQFDHSANPAAGFPPENGFGRIDHPFFGDVDISTTIPGDTYATTSALNAYTIDLEATKSVDFGSWWAVGSCGLRYASVKQGYVSALRDDEEVLLGTIDFSHRLRGVGPTVATELRSLLAQNLYLFGIARGSLLFGDGDSALSSGVDLDLDNPFDTNRIASRDDLLPIGELQLGLEWQPCTYHFWQPVVSAAFEGQLWSGAGNASSEDGDLGFVGFNIGLGCIW